MEPDEPIDPNEDSPVIDADDDSSTGNVTSTVGWNTVASTWGTPRKTYMLAKSKLAPAEGGPGTVLHEAVARSATSSRGVLRMVVEPLRLRTR